MNKLMTKTVALALSLLAVVGVMAVTTAGAATGRAAASSGSTAATGVTQPPVQDWNAKSGVYFYVDTVQGAAGSPKPAAGCAITNLFEAGQQVVFRMWGVNAKAGGVTLTDKTVKKAFVTIPQAGGTSMTVPLAYGAHGTTAYWTGAWSTTTTTPVGVVNFTLTVVTKPVKKTKMHPRISSLTGTFSQAGLPSVSQLTITPA